MIIISILLDHAFSLSFVLSLFIFSSCFKDNGSQNFGLTSPPNAPTSLSIISPMSQWGSDNTPTIRVEGVLSGHTVKLFLDSKCTDLVGSGIASTNYIDIISEELPNDPLTEDDQFIFYAQSSNSFGDSSCTTSSAEYNLGDPPLSPSNIVKIYPAEEESEINIARFTITDVIVGDTVKIFSDPFCSIEKGSIIAYDVDIEIETIPLTVGAYEFYVNSSNKYGSSTCSSNNASYTRKGIPEAPTDLSLAFPQNSPSSHATPVIQIFGIFPGSTVRLYSDSSCTQEVGSLANADSTSKSITSSSLSPGNYHFHATAENSYGVSPCSESGIEYSYGLPPNAPSPLTLEYPVSSPGIIKMPTIRISGLVSGNTVRLYSDSSCSSLLSSTTATSDSITITLASILPNGTHQFYANSTNIYGTSSCSSVALTYVLESCPSGYVQVPRNTTFGVQSDFCVMKYEARNNGSGTAVSDATKAYLTNLTAASSQSKCNDLGAKYDLISNQEWMTIVRNIESKTTNIEEGVFSRGWSASEVDDDWANTAAAHTTNISCLYNNETNTCSSFGDHLYKRVHYLSNGEEIWDLAGNLWEWVDFDKSLTGFQAGPTDCDATPTEFSSLSCHENDDLLFKPSGNLSSTDGIGLFIGGTSGQLLRGGGMDSGSTAGIFAAKLDGAPQNTSYGFRCVYRP